MIAAIHLNSWTNSFEGFMRADWLAQKTPDSVAAEWFKTLRDEPQSVHLAQDSNACVVGFICSGQAAPPPLAEYDSEILSIHISSEAKRMGHGRRLMTAAFQRLASLSCRKVMLWTLEHNSVARDFYQNLGGKVVGTSRKEFAGELQPVIAYGWDGLRL